MNRRRFEQLNNNCRVVSAIWFHQRTLRRLHSLPDGFGLCAAFVEVWWEAVRAGRPLTAAVELTSPAFVKDLLIRQYRSAWLLKFPEGKIAISTADSALLTSKYGTADTGKIMRRIPAAGALAFSGAASSGLASSEACPLAADLQTRYGVPLVESKVWMACATAPPVTAHSAREPGLRVLSLRYGTTGHRAAFVIESDGSLRFFDPNAGEVRFSCTADFNEWHSLFWQAAGYARRCPTVRFFRFTRGEPAATSGHGS